MAFPITQDLDAEKSHGLSFLLTSEGSRGRGCRLVLNGQDISSLVHGVNVHANVDEIVNADVNIFLTKPFRLELPSVMVNLNVTVLPFWRLVEEMLPNGNRCWRAEPDTRDELSHGDPTE